METVNYAWLLLDIGNTHTVAGLAQVREGRAVLIPDFEIRFRTDSSITADEYRAQLQQLLHLRGWRSTLHELTHVVVSTVVPALERTLRDCFEGSAVLFVHADAPREF